MNRPSPRRPPAPGGARPGNPPPHRAASSRSRSPARSPARSHSTSPAGRPRRSPPSRIGPTSRRRAPVRASRRKPPARGLFSPPPPRRRPRRRGCYIATSVYGSYDCPQVWVLRRFRDNQLAMTWYGRCFIQLYYAISPILVYMFGHADWFRQFWKKRLDLLVEKLQKQGIPDMVYYDKP